MNTGYSINWIPTGSSCCLDFSPASNLRSLISAKDRFRLNFDIKLGSPVLHKWPVSMKVFRKGWTFIFYRTATDVKTRLYSFVYRYLQLLLDVRASGIHPASLLSLGSLCS